MYAHMDARIYIISAHVALKMLVHIKQKLCNQLLNAIDRYSEREIAWNCLTRVKHLLQVPSKTTKAYGDSGVTSAILRN